jgi:hypothetical protein
VADVEHAVGERARVVERQCFEHPGQHVVDFARRVSSPREPSVVGSGDGAGETWEDRIDAEQDLPRTLDLGEAGVLGFVGEAMREFDEPRARRTRPGIQVAAQVDRYAEQAGEEIVFAIEGSFRPVAPGRTSRGPVVRDGLGEEAHAARPTALHLREFVALGSVEDLALVEVVEKPPSHHRDASQRPRVPAGCVQRVAHRIQELAEEFAAPPLDGPPALMQADHRPADPIRGVEEQHPLLVLANLLAQRTTRHVRGSDIDDLSIGLVLAAADARSEDCRDQDPERQPRKSAAPPTLARPLRDPILMRRDVRIDRACHRRTSWVSPETNDSMCIRGVALPSRAGLVERAVNGRSAPGSRSPWSQRPEGRAARTASRSSACRPGLGPRHGSAREAR